MSEFCACGGGKDAARAAREASTYAIVDFGAIIIGAGISGLYRPALPTMPRVEGVETLRGQSCHTARWPKEPVSFDGKRVAVIGTGATGVQTIQEVANTAGRLTVLQRAPNWCAPLHNGKIDGEERRRIKANYPGGGGRIPRALSGIGTTCNFRYFECPST